MIGSVRTSQWGDSLAVRIPKMVVDELELHKGMYLRVDLHGNAVTFTARATKRQRMLEYVYSITEDDIEPSG